MELKYDSMGVIFEKQIINDHIIFKAVSVNECYEIDNLQYNVKNNGEMENSFIGNIDYDDSTTIGYVIKNDDLIRKYGSIEDGIIALKEMTYPYIFIQDYDCIMESTVTYKLNLVTRELYKVANYKDNELTFCEKEIKEHDDNFLLDINLKDAINNKKEKMEETNEEKEEDIVEENTSLQIDIDMRELYENTKKSIIGQDDTIKHVVSAIDRNFNIDNYRNKTNILLIGPSGSGKTEMFRTIAEEINVPITIEDSEQYSAVGYMGNSIEDMLVKLYVNAEGDLGAAERGILVIDEIDKKVSPSKDDVSGTRVINSLLSLMEGTIFRINVGTIDMPDYISFDTSYLTVVLAGAFSDMIGTEKGMGINATLEKKSTYKDITIEKLKKYGLSDEFLGRVSIYKLNELNVDDLINIMKNSKNSALKEYYSYAEKKGIKLYIDDNVLRKIAEISIKKKTGARGIKATLDEILNDAFFEVCYNEGMYSSIKITVDSLEQEPPYKLYKKRNTKN